MSDISSLTEQLAYESYYKRIGRGEVEKVINELTFKLPNYSTPLQGLQAFVYDINKQNRVGTITAESYNVARTRINQAVLAFLDELSKGHSDLAGSYLVIGDEQNTALDEIIKNQLAFNQGAIRENKVFRTVVGLLFLIAVIFSIIVAYNHIDFLKDDHNIIGLLSTNILLYVCIGILAWHALSLIIKGNSHNENFLNFSRTTLKR